MTGVQQDCGGCLVLGVQGTYTSELTAQLWLSVPWRGWGENSKMSSGEY